MSDYANPHHKQQPGDNQPGGVDYVDFNQFVVQHNLAQQFHQQQPPVVVNNLFTGPPDPTGYGIPPSLYGAQSFYDPQPPYAAAPIPYQPFPATPLDLEIVRNSNLVPTASEFVPQQHHQPFDFRSFNEPPPSHFHSIDSVVEPVTAATVDLVQHVAAVSLEASPSQGAIRKTYQNGTSDSNRSSRHNSNNNNNLNGRKQGSISNSGDVRAGNYEDRRHHTEDRRNNDEQRRNHDDRRNNRSNGSGRLSSQFTGEDYTRQSAPKTDNRNQGRSNQQRDDTNWNRNNPFSKPSRSQVQDNAHASSSTSSLKQSPSSQSVNQSRNNNEDPKKFDKKKHPEFKPNRNLKPTFITESDTSECSQREKLIREIDAGRLECLVCCESIKPFQSTWSCVNCFHIIHLNCIVKWANSSKDEAGWRCPACQHVTLHIPDTYWCFCGKTKNPQYNRNDVAHSCGELCAKKEGCEHPCGLLCHPGPCATCHAMVTRQCGCGRTKKTMQCCQKDEPLCSEVCDKVLACGVHRCTLICHTGDCERCEDQVEHRCHCGKDKKQVPCVAENNKDTRYSCKKMCNKHLSCKNHKCKRVCHPGDCGDCLLLPENVTSCPCGKTPIPIGSRKVCTDPVPLCDSVCKRPLSCGQPSNPHTCPSKCHSNNCPPCTKETAVRCRCGHMEQMVKCRQLLTRSDDARCKKRCVKKRNCGKHKCNQECCIDIDHVCPLPCNFNLTCGKHKCDQTCHKGRCQRCYRSSFVELYCECGAQVIYPPVPCGTKKPACDKPCSRQHPCSHPVTHNCHSATQCPPCMAFISIFCHGKHEERKTIPCSQGEFSCGMPCQKPLKCGRHKCIKLCHPGACEVDADICKQNCTKLRVMCGHKCQAPCHSGDCPDTPCREVVEVLCQCGNRKAQRTCQEFAFEYRRIASAKFAATMEDMQRGNSIELSDVLGPLKMSNNKT